MWAITTILTFVYAMAIGGTVLTSTATMVKDTVGGISHIAGSGLNDKSGLHPILVNRFFCSKELYY